MVPCYQVACELKFLLDVVHCVVFTVKQLRLIKNMLGCCYACVTDELQFVFCWQ